MDKQTGLVFFLCNNTGATRAVLKKLARVAARRGFYVESTLTAKKQSAAAIGAARGCVHIVADVRDAKAETSWFDESDDDDDALGMDDILDDAAKVDHPLWSVAQSTRESVRLFEVQGAVDDSTVKRFAAFLRGLPPFV